ncbi:MAG: protease inhibitor I42 family protein [Gammaproteobacteria bacterium]
MTFKKIFLNVTAILILCKTPLALAANETTKPAEVIYSESRLNIVVEKKNPIFRIRLKSNPTTGYSWFLREYDHDLLVPVKHEFESPTMTVVGAPGSDVWTFKVKPTGFTVPQQSTLRMVYARPWQGADGSTQIVFRVSIVK